MEDRPVKASLVGTEGTVNEGDGVLSVDNSDAPYMCGFVALKEGVLHMERGLRIDDEGSARLCSVVKEA